MIADRVKTLANQWQSGEIPKIADLQEIMSILQTFEAWLSQTGECNILLVKVREEWDVALGMLIARRTNIKSPYDQYNYDFIK